MVVTLFLKKKSFISVVNSIPNMRFIQLSLLALIIFFTSSCVKKATKFYNRGLQKFDMEEFEFAAENMKQALTYGASPSSTNYYIAESYRQSNRLHEAEQYYAKALEAGNRDEHVHFYYAFAQKSNGNYLGAYKTLKAYLKYGSNPEYIERAKHEIKNLKELEVLAYKKRFYEVKNFTDLNTIGSEYSPMMRGDELYFTSSRGEGPMFPGQGTRFTDIYKWRFDGFNKFSGAAVPVSEVINIPHTHEATATFSPDGKTMIFSRSNSGKKNDITQEVDLFESKFEAGYWTEPVRLKISNSNTWDSNPCFSVDGTKLYFSSNRSGGFGGDDIWVATKNEDGEWEFTENIGKPVNTDGNDVFPYERPDGRFFFASDGHPGYGELDLFEVLITQDGSKTVRNLGKPVNTNKDDFGITFSKENIGYFSSNRPGGKGDDDIYYFEFDDIANNPCCINFDSCCAIKLILTGEVFGKKVDEKEQLTSEEIILPNAQVVLADSMGKMLATTVADSNGKFVFHLLSETTYILKASQKGYVTKEQTYSTKGMSLTPDQLKFQDNDVFVQTKIVLEPITKGLVIEFPAIYYDYNKWSIRPDAAKVLDLMVKAMIDNPTILVEIGSHTDSQGSADYNQKLSQNRAESAVKYILSKGIPANRLQAKGYGEEKPRLLDEEKSGFPAGTELSVEYIAQLKDKDRIAKAHQLNRRTDFTIVGVLEEE